MTGPLTRDLARASRDELRAAIAVARMLMQPSEWLEEALRRSRRAMQEAA